ncbi:MAG: hypothetical protein E5299_01562 [Burkholderia gladioli]|nr:MAG: hypothetical protein E5299_01562 [Burkholderia gladioli]
MHLTSILAEREMDFTPRAPLRVAVLAHLPFTFSINLQTGAVDNQIDRFIVTKDRQFDIKRFPGERAWCNSAPASSGRSDRADFG